MAGCMKHRPLSAPFSQRDQRISHVEHVEKGDAVLVLDGRAKPEVTTSKCSDEFLGRATNRVAPTSRLESISKCRGPQRPGVTWRRRKPKGDSRLPPDESSGSEWGFIRGGVVLRKQ